VNIRAHRVARSRFPILTSNRVVPGHPAGDRDDSDSSILARSATVDRRAATASGRTSTRNARENALRRSAASTHAVEPAHTHAPRPPRLRPIAS
jgi:hypothetical protein